MESCSGPRGAGCSPACSRELSPRPPIPLPSTASSRGAPRRRCNAPGLRRAARVAPMLTGALAAVVTPLRNGGATLDGDAFGPMTAFLANGGLNGILALGTTGEGVLLSSEERMRAAELFLAERPAAFSVAGHCGAQTTAETVGLAAHAARPEADAAAVIGPP